VFFDPDDIGKWLQKIEGRVVIHTAESLSEDSSHHIGIAMLEEGELVGFLMKVSSKMQKWCSLREETPGRTVFDEAYDSNENGEAQDAKERERR
jgi:hypothetical protein